MCTRPPQSRPEPIPACLRARMRIRPLSMPSSMSAIAFDRFHRYAELTEVLHALAARASGPRRHRIDRQEPRGPRHLGADGHQHDDRPAADKPAFWVDGNIHATEVAGVGREPVPAAHAGHAATARIRTSPARSTRAPSTSARASTPTAPNGRWPTEPKLDPFEHAAVSARRGRHRGPDRRGHRRRRPHPADAHPRSQRRVEGASGRAAADDPARSGRDRRHLLPRACPRARSRATTVSRCG